MSVHLYTVCWNEAEMLGFFFRHYDSWVDRYVIYDDGSTDASLDILQSHPKVEVRTFKRCEADSFVASHTLLQNNIWKESVGLADWVVITALDEHLWVQGRDMASYLAEQKLKGATLIPALGFNMIQRESPRRGACLVKEITQGCPSAMFNKLSIFSPDDVRETCFEPGRHKARPLGRLLLPIKDELLLWHFKCVGLESVIARESSQAQRMGEKDIANSWGAHYFLSEQVRRDAWNQMEKSSIPLGPGYQDPLKNFAPPLWWRNKSKFVRLRSRPAWMSNGVFAGYIRLAHQASCFWSKTKRNFRKLCRFLFAFFYPKRPTKPGPGL